MTRLRLLGAGALAAVLLLLLLGAVYLVGRHFDTAYTPEEATGSLEGRFIPTLTMTVDGREYAYYENYFTNILLIGVDKETTGGTSGYRDGGQADFLLLLSIDRHHRTITPVHIDRDTMTDVLVYSPFGRAAGEQRMQICLSHAFGAEPAENALNTVRAAEKLLGGIKIDHYLVLDMAGIALLNDAVGGVTVTLEDDFTHLDPEMTAGRTLRLEGRQAEYYVRGRHDVGDTTNRQRMSRQREFVGKLIPMLDEQVSADAGALTHLLDTLGPHLVTSMDAAWMSNQVYVLEHYERKEILSLAGTHGVGRDGFVEFCPDEDARMRLIRDVFMNPESEGDIS